MAILGADGRPLTLTEPKPQRRRLRASYDAAATTTRNERHWANADGKSAAQATSADVRQTLRRRARYECHESNSYAAGIVRTLANDTIGTGPRLQLMIPKRADAARFIERELMLWSYECRLAEKLRTMRVSKAVDGEAFAAFVTNPSLNTRVQLDLALIECDRVTSSSWAAFDDPDEADGIYFDRFGNPQSYKVLREHPGEGTYVTAVADYDTVPAEDMVHVFRCDRPGQRRGVPEIAPALPLFALLRRFTLATLHAAETAASYAGVLETNDPATDPANDAEVGDVVEVEHNSLLVLPDGRKLSQLKPEHPTTTFEMFKREVMREAARCLNVPYNVASGDSSSYNYASGRLDHQTYDRSIKIEQDYFGGACLDRTFMRWLEEAMLIPGYLPEGLPPFVEWNWLWFFDGRPHVDPLKEAAASTTLINGLLQTEKAYFAERGLDWEEQERQMATELGVTVAEFRKLKAVKRFVAGAAQEEMVRQILDMEAAQEAAASEQELANAD